MATPGNNPPTAAQRRSQAPNVVYITKGDDGAVTRYYYGGGTSTTGGSSGSSGSSGGSSSNDPFNQTGTYLTDGGLKSVDPSKVSGSVQGVYVGDVSPGQIKPAENKSELPSVLRPIDNDTYIKKTLAGDYGVTYDKVKPVLFGTSSGIYEENKKREYLANEEYRRRSALTKEIAQKKNEFAANPAAFKDMPGYTEQSMTTKEGVVTNYGLGKEFFTTLPTYSNYMNLYEKKGDSYYYSPVAEMSAKLFAKKSFSEEPLTSRIQMQASEMGYGAAKFGQGLKSFMVDTSIYGMGATYSKDASGKLKVNTVSSSLPKSSSEPLGMIPLREASYSPLTNPLLYTKELILERPGTASQFVLGGSMLYGAARPAVGNVKDYGWISGIKETAASFSPIQFTTKVWTPNVAKQFAESGVSKSVEFKYGQGEVVQMTKGVAGSPGYKTYMQNIQYSKSINGKSVGTSITEINYPYAKYVGGELTFGRMTTQSVNYFASTPKVNGAGFNAKVMSYARDVGLKGFENYRVSLSETTGARSDIPFPQNKRISFFGFTGGEKTAGFEKVGFRTYKFISGYAPQVKGYGVSFDLTKGQSEKGFSFITGGKGGELKLTGGSTPTIVNLKLNSPSAVVQTNNIAGLSLARTQRQAEDLEIKSALSSVLPSVFAQETKQIEKINTGVIISPGNILTTDLRKTFTTSLPDVAIKEIQGIDTKQLELPGMSQDLRYGNPITPGPVIDFNIQPPTPEKPGIRLPNLTNLGDLSLISKVLTGGRRKTGYTPSFSAIVFNIRGKAPKGVETGINFRPITKGFKFIRRGKL